MPAKVEEVLNKTIFIPVEIIDREIDGALLLAFEAISRGWKVIIGAQRKITENIESNETGIYFLKSITPGQTRLQKRIINSGSLIFSQDAEGLLQRPGFGFKMRFSKESLEMSQKVFFWGEKQKKDFIDALGYGFEEKCEVTGSPRADHWELISRSKKGNNLSKYILIATSFGNENHALGEDGQYNLAKDEAGVNNGSNSLKEFEKFFNDTFKLGMYLIPYYKNLIIELSNNFPNEEIILRPHPSENIEMWEELISPLNNVEIRTDRSIVDWLCESKVLIQYGSTTAIQSNILDVPVVTLVPKLPESIRSYDLLDSRRASAVYSNIEDLISDFREFLKDGSGLQPVDKNYIDKLIFSRKTVNSSKKIIDVIDGIYETTKVTFKKQDRSKYLYKYGIFKQYVLLLFSLIPFWNKFAPKRFRHLSLKSFFYYKKRKQPKIEIDEFLKRINFLKKFSSFNKKINIEIYRKNVFTLSLKD